MRTRTALPILLTSASTMLVGLGLASAQPQPQPRPAPRLPFQTPRIAPLLKHKALQKARPGAATPAPAAPNKAPGKAPSKATPTPAGPPSGATPPGAPTKSKRPPPPQFDTGIDYRPTPPGARVTFNLEDADLPDLVRLISSISGKRFILPGKVRSIKATVYAPTKVTAAEAYRAFLSILQLNGMTVVPSGRYLKIVETANIETQPLPTYTRGGSGRGDDRFSTRMHRIENVSAEDVAQLLGRFKSREGNITAYAPTNTLIITDMDSNIRRMLRVVRAIDVPRTGEQIWIEQIHHANAAELATRLQEIFPVGTSDQAARPPAAAAARRPTPARPGQPNVRRPGAAANAGAATVGSRSGETRITKILADERTNSLIILATERAYLRILQLIRELDRQIEGEGRIHVHYLQHGDSEEISTTLSGLIGGAGSARRPGQRGAPAAAAGGGGGADIFEGQVRVTAHVPSNALVITSSYHDYAALRRVIDELDSPRRQVFIEAVIMELSVDHSTSFGLSFHGGLPNVPSNGSLFLAGSNATSSLAFPLSPDTLTGLALGVRGPIIDESQQLIGASIPGFGVALNALATSGDTNILSTPHIIALDNEEAEISVGANVPLQTSGIGLGGLAGLGGLGGAQGAAGAGLAGLAGLAGGGYGSVPRQDVGTTIRITPHINDSDEVRLEIEEEISEAQASTEGTLGVRSINKRTAKTQMVVRDQQTVVIGGLMRDRVLVEESKIPILGDIPLIGALFRQTRRSTIKTNLLLFLTPYIIRDASDLRAIFERKMRERQEFIDRYFVFGDHDYEPPIDYSRTRGLVAEIINELDEMDRDQALVEAARARPPPEHVPRPPVGAAREVIIGPEGEEQRDEGPVPEPHAAPVSPTAGVVDPEAGEPEQ